MTYPEATEYLFNSAPLFQNIGGAAYKEGLSNTHLLDEHFGHPHRDYKVIHVAGTNGKGSCSHTLAAILQEAGYKVGLYTSPHLVDFRERIRVNGEPIGKERVVRFVEEERAFFEPLHPSFFELATALAFQYFKEQQVDIAVVEVGLGGRLDCTNIVTPILSLITNISFDHTQFLGHTLAAIAGEKAGIIKAGIPVVVGETTPETRPVFLSKAEEVGAPIRFAQEETHILSSHPQPDGYLYQTQELGTLHGRLGGLCQQYNTQTLLTALDVLKHEGLALTEETIRKGFDRVTETTGLMGRWQPLSDHPKTVFDTGHNIGGIQYIVQQLQQQKFNTLRIVIGMVNDKDVSGVLALLPKDAVYYFTQASVKRALEAGELQTLAEKSGLKGTSYPTVAEAYEQAKKDAAAEDFIFIGGSNFVVADLLTALQK